MPVDANDLIRSNNSSSESRLLRIGLVVVIGAFLIAHSQTYSGFFDESFHIIAAQLVSRGKLPYADFFYQHTPLFPLLTVGWMKVFGETWRSVHVFSTVLAIACIFLVGGAVARVIPASSWRGSAIVVASVLLGFNTIAARFATIGQPYALCLVLIVGSFVLVAYDGQTPRRAFFGGLCAGGAICASLLTLPVAPIELAWLLVARRASPDSRSLGLFFVAGAVVGLVPFLLLVLIAPHQAIFDTLRYHAGHRSWKSAAEARHYELVVVSKWINSAQALTLLGLSVAGVVSLPSKTLWEPVVRRELTLCALLVAGLGLFCLVPYPTFDQYFVFVIPLLSILAGAGFYAVFDRLGSARWRWAIAIFLCGFYLLGFATTVHGYRNFYAVKYWPALDRVGARVNEVTAAGSAFYSDDGNVYVTSGRLPSPGLENAYSPSMDVSPVAASQIHAMLMPQIDSAVEARRFATLVTCATQHRMDTVKMKQIYAHQENFKDLRCSLFW